MTTTGGTSTAGTTAVSAGQRPGEVVVGDDGTWHSRAALHHAADEAVRRGLPLTVLTITSAADQAVAPVSDAVQALRTRTPGLTVTAAAIINDGTEHLPESLAGCELLVLGNRGRSGVGAFLLGSVSRQLLRAARCPVLVVPDELRRDLGGGVLVGIRGDDRDRPVLRTAAREAVLRHQPLTVLHSTAGPSGRLDADGRPARLPLPDDVGQVTTIFTPQPPVAALLHHGGLAALIVTGTRGPLALARLATDSVSRGVLDGATGPVLVVPQDPDNGGR